jgi:hypothetical protein
MILSEVGLHFVFCLTNNYCNMSSYQLGQCPACFQNVHNKEHYFPPVIACWQVVSPQIAGV